MISRRKFLKVSALSAAALGAGFSTGKLIGSRESEFYALYGFVPWDEEIIRNIVSAFRNKIKSNTSPVVVSDQRVAGLIKSIDVKNRDVSFPEKGNVIYYITKLAHHVNSDIIISDSGNSIYSPEEFNAALSSIRNNLRNSKAVYFFKAEYRKKDFLSSLFNTRKKEIVIENENGIYDRIHPGKNYNNISVNGPFGKTIIRIDNGTARVHSASCRFGICRHSIASEEGEILACAPNKILIRTELV